MPADRADHHALALVVRDSVSTINELTNERKLRPHLKLLLRVVETASSTAKRLALALKESPEPMPEKPRTAGPDLNDLEGLIAILNGAICPDCGGQREPRDLLKE